VRVLPLIGLVGLLLGACSDDGIGRDGAGRITEAGELSVFDLRAGDCLNPPEKVQDELLKVAVVPCSTRHTQEVVGVKSLDTKDYPGDDAVRLQGEKLCLEPFSDYVGVDYVDSSLYLTYLLPSLRSWDDGDKDVTCIAQIIDADGVKGTFKGSER
jgi:hypothetical protein